MSSKVLVTRRLLAEALAYLKENVEVEGGTDARGFSRNDLIGKDPG